MGATPKGGTAYFRGMRSNVLYPKAFYNTDVSLGLVRWDAGGGQPASATTGTDVVYFNEPVELTDVACVTGVVDTGSLRVIANGNPTGHVILVATHLNTSNARPILRIGFNAGTRIGLMSVLPAA
jgi:hypothetical protein